MMIKKGLDNQNAQYYLLVMLDVSIIMYLRFQNQDKL